MMPALTMTMGAATALAAATAAASAGSVSIDVGQSAAPSIEVGEPFPDITLPTLDGEAMSIADFRGQKVVLHVFASW